MRSVGAGLAGLAAAALPAVATDAVLQSAGVFDALGQRLFLLATVYRCLYAVMGSWVAARCAPSRPMLHAMVLGGVGLIVAAVGAAVTWDKGPQFGPKWYPLALVATALPCAWLGARIAKSRLETI